MSNSRACKEEDAKQRERCVPWVVSMGEGGDGCDNDTGVCQGLLGDGSKDK
jgi:hypothetical protein